MLTALPLSINTRWMKLLAILVVMTRASSRGWCTQLASISMKTMSSYFGIVPLRELPLVVCTMVSGGVFASRAYLSRVHQLFPTSWDPPNMVPTYLLLGKSSVLPPLCGGGHLYGWVFFATGLPTACGLAPTLGLAVRCNITFKL